MDDSKASKDADRVREYYSKEIEKDRLEEHVYY
jgi:hypothetical protein